jgi:peroxiredoxin
MALVPTIPMELGFKAPEFTLQDTRTNKPLSLEELKSPHATVVMFICNHCPYVKHIMQGLVGLAQSFLPKGVAFIAISSNDTSRYPEDGPEQMKALAEKWQFPFPYLYDETQEVAKAYQAACTPDFNIFDGELKCVYRGQLDDSRPGNGLPVTGSSIRKVLDAILLHQAVPSEQRPSIGCSIKWKTD